MRTYYKQLGINKKIIIIASPVVQANYKLQLFDKRKLKKINGEWDIKSCTGNKFLKEIDPTTFKNLDETKIIRQIDKIINQSYEFMGYTGFANKIDKLIKKSVSGTKDPEKMLKRKKYIIKKEFSDRMIVIDEVHNVRSKSTKIKRTTQNMLDLVTHAENMKLMLLTATPMFNDYKEIIWLINLLNLNDNRFPIKISDVFDGNGNFTENGQELLIRKITGYVSYVSGENPFTFPHRIWPYTSDNPHSIKKLTDNGWNYPTKQINGLNVEKPINNLDIVITKLHEEQNKGYEYIVKKAKEKNPILNEQKSGIQYTVIDGPQQGLNMIYPNLELGKEEISSSGLYGKTGLNRTMYYDKNKLTDFEYSENTLSNHGRLFSSEGGENSPLRKYSAKIYSIVNTIKKSKGIILIYSNFIDGGCIPIALALEEIGFTRFGNKNKSLFKNPPVNKYKIPNTNSFGKYVMITGTKNLSISNKDDLQAATDPDNINGEKVKVVIISRAGSEGLDFQNIRQVHILEPWFNMNRADQIIGRGVRNKSHCKLPFSERNVQIFLYGSELIDNTIEPIDMYVYRLAEYKSIRIGRISRILKENAVDCLINSNQQNMIESKLNKIVDLNLSTGENIKFSIGYKNNSIMCDFMNCEYSCKPTNSLEDDFTESIDTYSKNYIIMNNDKIIKRIKDLFKEHYIYTKLNLIKNINSMKTYSKEQINMALDTLIKNKEQLTDMFNRPGLLINIDDLYLFQPLSLTNNKITHFQRMNPLQIKTNKISIKLKDNIKESKIKEKTSIEVLLELQNQFNIMITDKTDVNLKNNWFNFTHLVINNLSTHDKIPIDKLHKYCLEHLFDTKPIKYKLNILNAIYKNERNDLITDNFKDLLRNILDKFTINTSSGSGESKGEDYTGFVAADYNQEIVKKYDKQHDIIFILDKTKNEWIKPTNSLKWTIVASVKLAKIKINKFMKYKNKNILNPDIIGVLTMNKSNMKYVFKTLAPKDKKQKGLECLTKGSTLSTTIGKINSLTKLLNNEKSKNKLESENVDKYYSKLEEYKLKLTNIEPNKNDKKKVGNKIYRKYDIDKNTGVLTKTKTGNNAYTINKEQLCIEMELLLRHLDEQRLNDKRWFLSSIEDNLNIWVPPDYRKIKKIK